MIRRALYALIAGGMSLLLLSAQSDAATDPVFGQIDSIVQSLSEITGLAEKHPVPYGRMTKRQLRHFLNKRIKKTLKPEEIYADELALKMFGFVPQDFDLRKSTVDLLTEQAAAFYDYDEKKLFLLNDSSIGNETVTLAHELAHALADQHFRLANFMEDTPSNDDENLAHSAVVEGEASWLMMAYMLKQAGQEPVPTPEALRAVVDSSPASMAEFPVLKEAPLYLRQSLLFPYTEGTKFFDAVYKRLGRQAFMVVFTNAPTDSAQIMHPERYFAHEQPAHPALPQADSLKEAEEITEGSVGEFDHSMLLRQFAGEGEASALSPHVRGGQFRIMATGKGRKPVLQYSSEWDSPEKAAAFFALYPKILNGKWKRCDISLAKSSVLAGTGDNGMFVVRLSGNTVRSLEGLSDAEEWRRLKAAPEENVASRDIAAANSIVGQPAVSKLH
ncbi:MAG: hypothetical protein JO150_09725 [Acidobacteriaceae bacterium]|nr:hypothetical protein [Acidobacteriaceae bacterium]